MIEKFEVGKYYRHRYTSPSCALHILYEEDGKLFGIISSLKTKKLTFGRPFEWRPGSDHLEDWIEVQDYEFDSCS